MKIIIAGAHAIGTHLARLLSRSKEEITLIDESEERLASIGSDCDLLTMLGKPTSLSTLRDAGVADADLFIAVTPIESMNITASILAKNLGAKRTVARVDNPEYMEPQAQEFFRELGISKLIYPEMLAAVDINNGLKMSWVRQRWDVHDGALVMLGIKLREGCEILNEPLKNISGPNDPYHVVAIKRGSDTIIPGGNDELKLYDLAYFMTTRNYIPYIRKIVGNKKTLGMLEGFYGVTDDVVEVKNGATLSLGNHELSFVLIPDDSSVRSDKPGLLSGGLQDRLDHVARRGLSLCPGDPDRDQLLRRIAESRRGEFRQCKSSVFYPDHRHICRDFHFFFYHEDLAARL